MCTSLALVGSVEALHRLVRVKRRLFRRLGGWSGPNGVWGNPTWATSDVTMQFSGAEFCTLALVRSAEARRSVCAHFGLPGPGPVLSACPLRALGTYVAGGLIGWVTLAASACDREAAGFRPGSCAISTW